MKRFKKLILKQLLVFFITTLSSAAFGQNLTDEMINKINTTEKLDIFSIAETVKFDGQILRASEIVFGTDCVLELTNLNHPWIVLMADKIKFTAPLKKATIKRAFEVYANDGNNGTKGSTGSNSGRSGRHGDTGGEGGTGTAGQRGETKQLPKIYIVTNKVTSQESSQAPDFINLKLLFPGIDGGNGGDGGDGGRGGSGLKSANGALDCKRGAGDGGRGGIAGKGGKGGDSGNGGNDADIIFVGSESALEVLSYSVIINTGGDSGIPGQPGSAGSPGNGGSGGSGSTHCGGGDRGGTGELPSPRNLGNGSMGTEGAKGKVEKYSITKVSNLAIN